MDENIKSLASKTGLSEDICKESLENNNGSMIKALIALEKSKDKDNLSDHQKEQIKMEKVEEVCEYSKVVLELAETSGASKELCKEKLEENNGSKIKTLIELEKLSIKKSDDFGGISMGVINNSKNYAINTMSHARQGHGFAAENANHLVDKLLFKNAELIGGDNALNGADRLVNGAQIQSKYCQSGRQCINSCFNDKGFKYLNTDNTPMKIEVPKDMYDDAVKVMAEKISAGEVPGVTDPNEAKNIVKKGYFTYKQAVNIAKAGTIESLTFDAVNSAIVATSSMGISAVITFGLSTWHGEDFDLALENAIYSGLKVGGVTFVTGVVASQISRTGFEKSLIGVTEYMTKAMGPKVTASIANASRVGPNIYGSAATKNVAKLLRGNIVTGVATTVVLSSADIARTINGTVSGKQLFKNVSVTATGVAGGILGGMATGAAVGSVIPVAGNVVGAVVGGIGAMVAGGAASSITKATLDNFIEDDAEKMISILKGVFEEEAMNYLLNENEITKVSKKIGEIIDAKFLREMYGAEDRRYFIRKVIIKEIKAVVRERKYISEPNNDQILMKVKTIVEKIEDEGDKNE